MYALGVLSFISCLLVIKIIHIEAVRYSLVPSIVCIPVNIIAYLCIRVYWLYCLLTIELILWYQLTNYDMLCFVPIRRLCKCINCLCSVWYHIAQYYVVNIPAVVCHDCASRAQLKQGMCWIHAVQLDQRQNYIIQSQ